MRYFLLVLSSLLSFRRPSKKKATQKEVDRVGGVSEVEELELDEVFDKLTPLVVQEETTSLTG